MRRHFLEAISRQTQNYRRKPEMSWSIYKRTSNKGVLLTERLGQHCQRLLSETSKKEIKHI